MEHGSLASVHGNGERESGSLRVVVIQILQMVLVGRVCADFKLELQLVRYLNPTHRIQPPSEKCCDPARSGGQVCSDSCDNSLQFCLSFPGSTDCSLGQLDTGLLLTPAPAISDNITFTIGGELIAENARNPLMFTGEKWPVRDRVCTSVCTCVHTHTDTLSPSCSTGWI